MPKQVISSALKVLILIIAEYFLYNLHSYIFSPVPLVLELGLGLLLVLSIYGIGKNIGGCLLCGYLGFLAVLYYCQSSRRFLMLQPLFDTTKLGAVKLHLRAYVFTLIWLFVLFCCGSVLGEAFFAHPKRRILSSISLVIILGCIATTLHTFGIHIN